MGLLSDGHVAEATALREAFSPDSGRAPATFKQSDIAEDRLLQAVESAICMAFNWLEDRSHVAQGLKNLEVLVAWGCLPQSEVDKKIRSQILSQARWNTGINPALQPYVGTLVTSEDLATVKSDKITSHLKNLRHPEYMSINPAGYAAALKELGVAESEIDGALKEGYLHLLAKSGRDRDSKKYRPLLKPGAVTADEEREALATYTEALIKNINLGKDWLSALAEYREFFRPGTYQDAVFNTAYMATYGYHSCPNVAVQLRTANPDFPWSLADGSPAIDGLKPPCRYRDTDLRAVVAARIVDPVESTLARVLFDWLGASLDRPDSVGCFLHFLRDACAQAVGLVKKKSDGLYGAISAMVEEEMVAEGSTTRAEIKTGKDEEAEKNKVRAQRIQDAFGGNLHAVPYAALVRLRQKVSDALREVLPDASIDFI